MLRAPRSRRANRGKGWLVAGFGLVGALTSLTGSLAAAPAPLTDALTDSTRRARRSAPELAVHVVDLSTGEEAFALDPDRRLIIASNTKLLTTAAALEHLGPGFFFETRLFLRGRLQGDTLVGDMAVVGGGDPNFSGRHHYGDPLAVFRGWAERLRELGVRRIDGDVFLDHGAFEDLRIHPDWPRDQLSKWYEAPVDALSFSDNSVLVRVRPGRVPGRPAKVELLPDLDIFTVRNQASTTSSRRRHWLAAKRRAGSNEIVVSGRLYRHVEPIDVWVTVEDPVEYFGAAMIAGLKEGGVGVSGRGVPVSELPPGGWWNYGVHRSDLLTTLEVINTRSQNFYAESLLKTLGRQLCAAGTWQAGREFLGEFLDRIGIGRGTYDLADGSGMSRNNRFTPRQLTQLLEYMYRHPLGREFAETLPYSGLESHGRWRKRLAWEPYRGRVFAKTGSLRSVSTLSGYARGLSGKTYAFSILCNDVPSVMDARRAQDRIVMSLIDNG
ncbi:MAG: D-alanyl-D-alanine carboxypeptidase/D-alanyl-D-alanine-endopeptidase [Acidobacteriota bacterium]|nr:D-alanyl-D-alanine carboxypeptidase/D-alanyl-D-alanine-endopeptidase [Acidobacteriota bacterium]